VVTAPTDVLVTDVIEAQVRTLMAKRAALPVHWQYRAERAKLSAEISALLERYNRLTLGR
jgi:hypothetical protein